MQGTYKLIELVGTSAKSYEEAMANAVKEASKTIHDMAWFEVVEQRGKISNGKIAEFQAKLRIAFKLLRD